MTTSNRRLTSNSLFLAAALVFAATLYSAQAGMADDSRPSNLPPQRFNQSCIGVWICDGCASAIVDGENGGIDCHLQPSYHVPTCQKMEGEYCPRTPFWVERDCRGTAFDSSRRVNDVPCSGPPVNGGAGCLASYWSCR